MPHWRASDWSLPWPSVVVGFLLLAVPPLVLFGFGVWGTLLPRRLVVLSLVLAAGTIAVGAGIRCEWWELRRVIHEGSVVVDGARWNLVAVGGGTLVTVAGVTALGLSPIVAASLVGVAAAVGTRSVAVPVYCGAFVGMTSPKVFGSYWQVTLAAVLAGVLFIVAHPVFHGLGGKLGTTAFVGVSLVAIPTANTFQSAAIPGESVVVSVIGFGIVMPLLE